MGTSKTEHLDAALDRAKRAAQAGIPLHEQCRRDRLFAKHMQLFGEDGVCPGCGGKKPLHLATCKLVR